jgi:hypothetical protein
MIVMRWAEAHPAAAPPVTAQMSDDLFSGTFKVKSR